MEKQTTPKPVALATLTCACGRVSLDDRLDVHMPEDGTLHRYAMCQDATGATLAKRVQS